MSETGRKKTTKRLDELPRFEAAKERARRLEAEGMVDVFVPPTAETKRAAGKTYTVVLAQFGAELIYRARYGETTRVPVEVARIAYAAGIIAQPPKGYESWANTAVIGAQAPMLAMHSDPTQIDPGKNAAVIGG